MSVENVNVQYGPEAMKIETGKLAKQANGSVMVTYGGTAVLVTACMSKSPREGVSFFPLMVEYQEKTYSAGQIPGGFFKREGRPTQKEILTARVIDRPIRPLFPEGMFNEVQVVATVLSSDGQYDPDILALNGASAALQISDIPFSGPISGARVAVVDGENVLNPTYEQREAAELEFVVAAGRDGLVMIEGEAKEAPEEKILAALAFAQEQLGAVLDAQDDLLKKCGKEKADISTRPPNDQLLAKVKELAADKMAKLYAIEDKIERQNAGHQLKEELTADLSVYDSCKRDEEEEITSGAVLKFLDQIEYEEVRRRIFEEGRRADGRGLTDVREITCEAGVLPRTHGSSLFTRGQTQSLATVTLGTKRDEQLIESLEGTSYKNFMLHYNFPPFSVGEVKFMRGPSRRDIGHGTLASKAIKALLPAKEDFPYTVRVVSEILESNGSSSMATVSAASMALMDAGVPISAPVAGISIGLVTQEGKDPVLLTDIMGLEDHFGDMDFKVAGTEKGVTAIQMDIKIQNVSLDLLRDAIAQAREARNGILAKMKGAIEAPREQMSEFAPKIVSLKVPEDKIGGIIGPGGKTIKKIIETYGCESIDIDDDGTVVIFAMSQSAAEDAHKYIAGFTEEPEVGKVYDGRVVRIMNFGAFVEFLPGREGLVHVSELSDEYVENCEDVVSEGDEFKVKLIGIDKMKRFNLSKKQA
ncbi:MAG: polyribonucleotide nucleotidyltransferase [Candidatus Omnitrophota bacterium]